MKTSLVIALTVAFVLGAGGGLAAMNKSASQVSTLGAHPRDIT
jgi:hypothetical protein